MKRNMPSEPVWYKQYCTDLSRIHGLPDSGKKCLLYILANMDQSNNLTILGGARKKMLESIGIADQTLRNRLAELVKSELLAIDGHGVYIANPYIFTKKSKWGDTLNMRRKFKALFIYSAGQRKISGEWDE